MSLSPDLKAQILAHASAMPSPTIADAARSRRWLVAVGVVAALSMFVVRGGIRVTDRPLSLVLLTSLGTAVAAIAAGRVLLTRGGSMSGRPARTLWLAAVGACLAFLAWKYAMSHLYDHTQPWPTRSGFRCLGVSLSCAAPLALAGLLAGRQLHPLRPFVTGCAWGAGTGLVTAVMVDLWCPVAHFPHLLLGHLLPIAVLALVGGFALRMRTRNVRV